MNVGKILLIAVTAVLVAAAPGLAEEEEAKEDWLPGTLSGNVTVVTDYSFRGISQTDKNMALQGGIDWEHETGIFAGIWGSSLDYSSGGSGGYLQQDFYGGYAGSIEKFSYDITAIFLFYPGDEQYNYWEFVLGAGYDFDFMSVKAGFLGSPDYRGRLDTGLYASTGFEIPIPLPERLGAYLDLSLGANAGYTHTDRLIFADHHYFDWNTGLIVGLPFNLSLDFRYVGTDVKDVSAGDDRFVFGSTYGF